MNTMPPCDTFHLNLKTYIEGRYIPTTNLMFGDSIQVELRNNYSPYSLVETSSGYLNDSGNCSLKYYYASNGTNYYIVIKHKNSLETWSISPGQMFTNDILDFDFLSYSQAYGGNLRFLDSVPLWFGMFSGDVDQDGEIDLDDVTSIYNNSNNFLTGITDLNGDGITDLNDMTIVYNNSVSFISIRKP